MILESKFPCPEAGYVNLPARVAELLTETNRPVYLAVYVYALSQYVNGNHSISNSSIADALKINLMDVVNAFLFYSSQGMIKIHNFTSVDDGDFDIEFCTVDKKTPVPFRPNYKSSEISRRLQENSRMNQMYKMVSQILGKTLSSSDTELLYSFHDYYGLPVEVILVLIEYYVSKGKTSMKYIEKEAGKWHSAGIDTVPKAKAHIKKREEFLSYVSRVRTLLGIPERRLSTRELTYINNWQNEFSMTLDMVKTAYELTVNQTGKLSFAYMNKIMESWAQNNIQTPQDIAIKKAETPKSRVNSRYDFEAMERRAREALNHPDGGKESNGV